MLQGLLFDKDGTLFDFGGTWNGWARAVLAELSGGDPDRARALAEAVRFDLAEGRFHRDSPVIAGTNREVAMLMHAALPGWSLEAIERLLSERAAGAELVPATPLGPLFDGLRARGLALGVMTNDTEHSARHQLRHAGIEGHFAFIAGSDSGHGAKPDAAPLLAFARQAGLAPGQVAMVGDSTHDLLAAGAAGMRRIAVLSGPAARAELAPHADLVLPDIGHLPAWLDAQA